MKTKIEYTECKKCGSLVSYEQKDILYDYGCISGYYRYLKCPHCDGYIILKYVKDKDPEEIWYND